VSSLVDSDWIIDALAGVSSAQETLQELSEDGLAVSTITLGELLEGTYGFPDPEAHIARLEAFLRGFRRIEVSEPIMAVFARLRSELRRQGQLIPDLDLVIAATALHHNLVLLTRNRRHFDRIPGLQIYEAAG
jgi:tRNA(fMet)-specific endonuclease VapC